MNTSSLWGMWKHPSQIIINKLSNHLRVSLNSRLIDCNKIRINCCFLYIIIMRKNQQLWLRIIQSINNQKINSLKILFNKILSILKLKFYLQYPKETIKLKRQTRILCLVISTQMEMSRITISSKTQRKDQPKFPMKSLKYYKSIKTKEIHKIPVWMMKFNLFMLT